MAQREFIKDWQGKVLGTVETASNGDKKLKDFYGRVLGTYERNRDVTKDFYGHIVGHGDILLTLLR